MAKKMEIMMKISDEALLKHMPTWEKKHGKSTIVLEKLFANVNVSVEEKVRKLDGLYRTHLAQKGDIDAVIEVIENLGDLWDSDVAEVIGKIRQQVKSKLNKNDNACADCLSFASKYCTFSSPEKFIIYDRDVSSLLYKIDQTHAFTQYSKSDFGCNTDYQTWLNIMERFRNFFSITLDSRTLDKCLWGSAQAEKQK